MKSCKTHGISHTVRDASLQTWYCGICKSDLGDTVPPASLLSTEGVKHDQDKVQVELLSPIALIEIAKVLTYGSRKYAANNWRKGMKWSRVLGAAMRHLLAYLGGQDKDPETGLSHIAHLACCAVFILEYEVTHKELDDRYKV